MNLRELMPTNQLFPIVTMGSSAGGLCALEAFFKFLPNAHKPDMSFVIIQHLSPNHTSILPKLIQQFTSLPVLEITDGLKVEPNRIYVIPPNCELSYHQGTLKLRNITNNNSYQRPIDHFIISLAKELGKHAIAIILSGAGSDGSLGLTTLKMNGGLAIIQKPESAEFSGMPKTAIATGHADFILTPEEMPVQIIKYVEQLHKIDEVTNEKEQSEIFKIIFSLLRLKTGHDFSEYKTNTIIRRAERRMALHQIDNLISYVKFLKKNPTEVSALFKDLLIGVTSFFRDPEAFHFLEVNIIPKLFLNKSEEDTIRIWSVACSTGEEAYTLAILIHEAMEKLKCHYKVLIFATDVNQTAIEHARLGLFSASIAEFVSPVRLKHFFKYESDSGLYRISKSLRDMIIFSEQDVVKDPPFSRIDLITCRNLLIYMRPELQNKTIGQFHYALKPNGYLFLGSSETPGDYANSFLTLDRKFKIYQKIDSHTGSYTPDFNVFSTKTLPIDLTKSLPGKTNMTISSTPKSTPLRDLTEKILFQSFAPPSVLINDRFEVLYIHGRINLFLEPASGEATMNILKMAKEELRRDLTVALTKAINLNEFIVLKGLTLTTAEKNITINIKIRPIIQDQSKEITQKLFLVSFKEIKTPSEKNKSNQLLPVGSMTQAAQILALEKELFEKDEFLRSTRDELQSSNQEMQSNNEELQSTNEELETSKEELQSVNEELATTNAELQSKVVDLSHANNDMNNLLAGTGIGTIFVDHNKNVVRFTPTATKLINLIQADMGRPLEHISTNFKNYNSLLQDVQLILDELVAKEIEVQIKNNDWYLMRIRPYRTIDNIIEGAVISFFDITQVKKIQNELEEANKLRRLAIAEHDALDAIVVIDLTGKIIAWNPSAERIYGRSGSEAIGSNLVDFLLEQNRDKEIQTILKLSHGDQIEPHRTQRIAKDGRIIDISLTATPLLDSNRKLYAVATTERQIGKMV